MERLRLSNISDMLAETITEIEISQDFKRWVTYDNDGNPVKLELSPLDVDLETDKATIFWPLSKMDMSLYIEYTKSAGEFNISKVKMFGPKAEVKEGASNE